MDARVARGSRFDDESVGDIHIPIPYGLYCQVLALMNSDAKHSRVEEVGADALRAFLCTHISYGGKSQEARTNQVFEDLLA